MRWMTIARPSRRRFAPPESLTRNECSFSNMLGSGRHSRESGNPGASGKPPAAGTQEQLDPTEKLLWTPAFAGVTITYGFHCIHFGPASQDDVSLGWH